MEYRELSIANILGRDLVQDRRVNKRAILNLLGMPEGTSWAALEERVQRIEPDRKMWAHRLGLDQTASWSDIRMEDHLQRERVYLEHCRRNGQEPLIPSPVLPGNPIPKP